MGIAVKKNKLTIKKSDLKWILSLVVGFSALFFQNCGGDFQTLDEFKYGSDYAKNFTEQSELQSYWDRLYNVDELRSQSDTIFDTHRDPLTAKFFADEITAFLVVTNRSTTASMTLVVDNDQVLTILVQSTRVTMTHEAPAGNYSQIYFNIDSGVPVVVAARSGKDPKNVLIMVNGEYRTFSVQNKGTPLNFSYLENRIDLKNVQEAFIIHRTMEPGEINVVSRSLTSAYGITSKTSKDMPDYLAWSTESKLFPQVRALMKTSCFKCHSAWISLSENGFTTASKYTKNLLLVKPKSLPESLLWHSLQGSVGETKLDATRNMPKDLPALPDEQLKLLKSWIMGIP